MSQAALPAGVLRHCAHLPGAVLTKKALRRRSYVPAAIEEETEARRRGGTHPLLHSLLTVGLVFGS